MAVQKDVRFLYQAKNNTTGLTDVKAQVFLNGSAKAVGGSALVLTEVDATNAPGLYELLIPSASLVTWGVLQSGEFTIEGIIDSATQPAPAPFKQLVTVASEDDVDVAIAGIETKLGTPAGASVSADIAALLTAVQVIQNNAGFAIPVPSQLAKPATGSNVYRIPLTIYNDANALIDPDSNSIVVSLANSAGTDRGSMLTGYTAGSAPAVRDSLGQYHIDVTIASTAVEEELIFDFAYAIAAAATARKCTTVVVSNASITGFALQSTLLDVQTTIGAIDTNTAATQTLAAGADGFAAIKADTAAIKSDVESGTYGLSAIHTFLVANVYIGGKAV